MNTCMYISTDLMFNIRMLHLSCFLIWVAKLNAFKLPLGMYMYFKLFL